jgi:hypothetical protein
MNRAVYPGSVYPGSAFWSLLLLLSPQSSSGPLAPRNSRLTGDPKYVRIVDFDKVSLVPLQSATLEVLVKPFAIVVGGSCLLFSSYDDSYSLIIPC